MQFKEANKPYTKTYEDCANYATSHFTLVCGTIIVKHFCIVARQTSVLVIMATPIIGAVRSYYLLADLPGKYWSTPSTPPKQHRRSNRNAGPVLHTHKRNSIAPLELDSFRFVKVLCLERLQRILWCIWLSKRRRCQELKCWSRDSISYTYTVVKAAPVGCNHLCFDDDLDISTDKLAVWYGDCM